MSAFDLARLRLKARHNTSVLMRRYSVMLNEAEARLMDGNR